MLRSAVAVELAGASHSVETASSLGSKTLELSVDPRCNLRLLLDFKVYFAAIIDLPVIESLPRDYLGPTQQWACSLLPNQKR